MFSKAVFNIIPFALMIIYNFFYKLYKLKSKDKEMEVVFDFLNTISVTGIISMAFIYMNGFFTDIKFILNFGIILTLCIFSAVLLYIFFKKYIKLSFYNFKFILFLSLSITFIILILRVFINL